METKTEGQSQSPENKDKERRDRDTGQGTEPQIGQQGQLRWERTPDLVWPRGWFSQRTRGLEV